MIRIVLPVVILILSVTSCTVYREYPIDVYKPGDVSVPPEAKNVALIYRNFKYPGDTLQSYYKFNHQLKKSKTKGNLDSVLVGACLTELAKNLKSENSFNQIRILPYDLFNRHTGEKLPVLNNDLIDKVANSTNSDLLISLETFSYFFSEYPQNYDTPKSNEVITAAVWAIYDPGRERILERKAMIDTIYWNGYDNQGNYQKGYQLPPRETALRIAAQLAGENYAKRFFASWQTVNRTYIIPPLPDFSDAAYYIDQGKWDNAIDIWKRYASDNNGKLAISARFNLALAYEMKDNFEMASKWLTAARDQALLYRSREDIKMIISYQKILEKRKQEINRLQN